MALTYSVFLQPRGFIKFIQFIFVICAFACTCDFRGYVAVDLHCNATTTTATTTTAAAATSAAAVTSTAAETSTTEETTTTTTPTTPTTPAPPKHSANGASEGRMLRSNETKTFTGVVQYTFNLEKVSLKGYDCSGNSATMQLSGDYSAPSSFFVFVGVSGMLYVLLMVFVYSFLESSYQLADWMPLCDMIVHIIYTVMWFAGAIAWAAALTSIKKQLKINAITSNNDLCTTGGSSCSLATDIKYQLLDFSVIFGFLDVILFGANIWFVYKETRFFNSAPHPTVS